TSPARSRVVTSAARTKTPGGRRISRAASSSPRPGFASRSWARRRTSPSSPIPPLGPSSRQASTAGPAPPLHLPSRPPTPPPPLASAAERAAPPLGGALHHPDSGAWMDELHAHPVDPLGAGAHPGTGRAPGDLLPPLRGGAVQTRADHQHLGGRNPRGPDDGE